LLFLFGPEAPQIPAEAFSFAISAMLVFVPDGVTGFLTPAPKLAVFQMLPKASAFLAPPAAVVEFGVEAPVVVLLNDEPVVVGTIGEDTVVFEGTGVK